MLVFSSAGMASPLGFFSASCSLSRGWKGLGQRESMAQKTPHVSASQWQITVPSPKRRRLKEQNHSVFSLLWKRELGCLEGERGADGGFGGGVIVTQCSDFCRSLRREIQPISPPMPIHLGGRRRHTPSADYHPHRVKVFVHREKSLAELKSRIEETSAGFCTLCWSITAACSLKPSSKDGKGTITIPPRPLQDERQRGGVANVGNITHVFWSPTHPHSIPGQQRRSNFIQYLLCTHTHSTHPPPSPVAWRA